MDTSSAVTDEILLERIRQIEVNYRLPHNDDSHINGQMAGAAACYLLHDLRIGHDSLKHRAAALMKDLWPWSKFYWKPKDHRRNLIRAAALIVAEIERLDRKAA